MERIARWKSPWLVVGLLSLGAAADTGHSPYAAQRHEDIKALSGDERAALLAGQGMGFAKAAELNGYPGPRHVIDLAAELELTGEQVAESQALFERMRADAQSTGAELIEAERALDRLYASKTATAERVNAALARIEHLRARLRGVHLNAHLEQAALMTPAQIERYVTLRGYGGSSSSGEHRAH